jgi:hypothetical protein
VKEQEVAEIPAARSARQRISEMPLAATGERERRSGLKTAGEPGDYVGPDWQARIKSDPSLRFTSHSLKPGSALAFSGSSQWHFRDPLPRAPGSGNFSNLLFFHFIPRGTAEWVEPQRWPVLLGLPELGDIIGTFSGLSPGRLQSVAPETLSPAKLR